MKDIYELFNDIDLDVNEIESVEVSELEKAKLKSELKKKILRRKSFGWKRTLTAASLAIGVSSAALFGISFTTFAEEIPVLGGIFKFFNNNGMYEDYDANANSLNLIREDNGIKVTIKEAIFDGRALYLTYEIESEKDLGENPQIFAVPNIKWSHAHISTIDHEIKKIDKNKYVGMTTGELLLQGKGLDKGSFDFKIESFSLDLASDTNEVSGKWDFQFELDATENHEQLVDLRSEEDGVTVKVTRITYTPMSLLINYERIISEEVDEIWDVVSPDIEVKDNLGNIYTNDWNGGFNNSGGLTMYYSNTLEKLDPKASSLIITPIVYLVELEEPFEYGPVHHTKDGDYTEKVIELDPIVVEIEK